MYKIFKFIIYIRTENSKYIFIFILNLNYAILWFCENGTIIYIERKPKYEWVFK